MKQYFSAVVVCGPSGVGKTTIGTRLAEALSCTFYEGDSYHSEANVAKMRSGTPLTDADRQPWLKRLESEVIAPTDTASSIQAVLACSALRRCYRDILREGGKSAKHRIFFVLLSGDVQLLTARLANRKGHYMPASLLASQLQTLEPLASDEFGTVVDLSKSPAEIVDSIIEVLNHYTATSTY